MSDFQNEVENEIYSLEDKIGDMDSDNQEFRDDIWELIEDEEFLELMEERRMKKSKTITQEMVDKILDKISKKGIDSLKKKELKILKKSGKTS